VMKRMTSAEIRQTFLGFFADRGHEVVASSSLVPGNDPTLLFTNSGMVQFKDVFLGQDQRPYRRATTSQKCMRISGKHNDLENVGPSPRHHTFFEMLGNFSFGDYFKRDAIHYAYELLTEVYGLPPDRLAFTIFRDDDEAYHVWADEIGVDPRRIARMGPKTNFWQMADTGPCGPTSEIHYDLQPEQGLDTIAADLAAETDRFLELWNLVFMQFNRRAPDPEHTGQFDEPLPAPGVDTGMGLERIAAVLQEVPANYDTDLFTDLMDATQEILGHTDAFRQEHYVAYRVIADHTRAATFLIADGVNPGTTGREYVTRMMIRRAWRFAHGMGVNQPFLDGVADAVVRKMGDIYPELRQFQGAIRYQIATEEERFRRMLDNSLEVMDDLIQQMQQDARTTMTGDEAFFLYATHGLPLEIIRDLLQDRGLQVDQAGFRAAMEEHVRLSGGQFGTIADTTPYRDALAALQAEGRLGQGGVSYNPYDYDRLTVSTQVVGILRDSSRVQSAKQGEQVEIVLATTPFYVESGGQVSDTGMITGHGWAVRVDDMRQPVGGLIVHVGTVTQGRVNEGDEAEASVDVARRWDIMRNHTATHLLHSSLRRVLGEHVRQKGSLVAPDRLRFDFSHNNALTTEEIDQITAEVNAMILANVPVTILFKELDTARREGAMALFGEKYGATVRTITIPQGTGEGERFSYELCGGTHVRSTAEIGPFLITAEESSGSGVRRIEAITGRGAQRVLQERSATLQMLAKRLRTEPDELISRLDSLLAELEQARQTIEHLRRQSAKGVLEGVLASAHDIDGIKVVAAVVQAPDVDLLAEMADWCRDRLQSGIVVLGSDIDGTARLVAKVTPDLVSRGIHAGKLVREAAKVVGGGGGGRPDFATAGGKHPAKLGEAIGSVDRLVSDALL